MKYDHQNDDFSLRNKLNDKHYYRKMILCILNFTFLLSVCAITLYEMFSILPELEIWFIAAILIVLLMLYMWEFSICPFLSLYVSNREPAPTLCDTLKNADSEDKTEEKDK
ncbi:MAG: hypothetical protein ACRC2T_05440 [Thermoguttaceae bacterium]